MKNLSKKFIFLTLIILGTSCSSLREAAKSRELLGKCTYELKEVHVKTLEFAPILKFDNSSKKINSESVSTQDLIKLLDQIVKGQFSLNLDKLQMDALVEIKNPNAKEVILDSMMYDCFLDETYLMKIGHYQHKVVPASSSALTNMQFDVPLNIPLQKVINAQEVVVKGKVWLRVKYSKNREITLPIPVKVKHPIPREEIQAKIDKEKERLIKELAKKAENDPNVGKVKKGIKKLLGF